MQESIAQIRGRALLPPDVYSIYCAAMAPVATPTFSPNGS